MEKPGYSFWTILGGIFIILLGAGAFAGSMYLGNRNMHKNIRQFIVPGVFTVELKKSGKYTIFNEYKSKLRGKSYYTPGIPKMNVNVRNKMVSGEIKVWKTDGSSIYIIGERSGQGLYEFQVDKPGIYLIDINWTNGDQEPKAVFSVTGSFHDAMMAAALRGGGFSVSGPCPGRE